MKQLISLTSLLLVVVWLAGTAFAQSAPLVIKVNIPFEFNVGDQSFPAGEYSLVQPTTHLLVLRDSRRQTIATTFTSGIESLTPPATSKLRFYSVGGQHVLVEVWQEQNASGLRLYGSNPDTAVAKRRTHDNRTTALAGQP
jgi:hypothetical protein